jgi:DNA-binding CsgD family transcriptional regulator
MFGLYNLDVTLIYMTEYYSELAKYYTSNLNFESTPKVIVTLLIIFTYRQIAKYSLHINISKIEYFMWAIAFLTSILIIHIDYLGIWIYGGITEFLLFYNVVISIIGIPSSGLSKSEQNLMKKILFVTLGIFLIGLMEHIIVLSTGSSFINIFPNQLQRRTMIEVLSIWFVGVGVFYLIKLSPLGSIIEKDEEAISRLIKEKELQSEKELHNRALQFGERCGLTNRESEILELLAKHYTNQQISDHLYISLGTVKVHVHSIFQKTGITSRDQVEVHLQAEEDDYKSKM